MMIQDIAPAVYENAYQPRNAVSGDYFITVSEGKILFALQNGQIQFPRLKGNKRQTVYLFSISQVPYFWYEPSVQELDDLKQQGYILHTPRELRPLSPADLRFAAITAYQLIRWYQDHHFCGRCASVLKPDLKERMLQCPHCGQMVYPKICPAVIVGILSGDRILLTQYSAGEHTHHYALVAGFAEIGETIEETVHREVLEETGLQVKNLHYYKSQPWSFSDTLLLGFFCEVDGSDEVHLDDHELSLGIWKDPAEMPVSDEISLTSEMMEQFRKYGRKVLERSCF